MKKKKTTPNLAGAFNGGNIDVWYDFTRPPILAKYADKLQSFCPEVQNFYRLCKDLDVEKEYDVAGFENKIKGIDLLKIMDIIYQDRKDETRNLVFDGTLLYYNKEGTCVGYLSTNGFNKFSK